MSLIDALNLLLLGLGFGFVIFWHELGHFLAAKWAKVRVEQFAVGFGTAIVSYRQGLGFRRGTSAKELAKIQADDPARAASISPTEYRLNWLPLGGYVKMLGQEDLAVDASQKHEPDSYQAKTVGQRMVIISAGVVMNVILAGIGFAILYFIGFSAAAAKLGLVMPGSPADAAGLRVGDEVIEVNGTETHDFNKLRLSVALLRPDEEATFLVQPYGTSDPGERREITVTPEAAMGAAGMVGIGVAPTPTLAVPGDLRVDDEQLGLARRTGVPELLAVLPGETVTAVDDTPTGPADYAILHRALQSAADNGGRPVELRVEGVDGIERIERLRPSLPLSADAARQFGGLRALLRVIQVTPTSPLAPGGERDEAGQPVLMPGDVLLRVALPETGDVLDRPGFDDLRQWLNKAGQAGQTIDLTVRRDGEEVVLRDLPLTPVSGGWISRLFGNATYGLGALLEADLTSSDLAGSVADGSPADEAGLDAILNSAAMSARLVEVNGVSVSNWYDANRELRAALDRQASPTTQPASRPLVATVPVTIELTGTGGSERRTLDLPFDLEDAAPVRGTVWIAPAVSIQPFSPSSLQTTRQTNNPLQAAWWGVFETRDQIVNLYLTLKRVAVDRTVSPRNLSGPVGILHFGTIVAQRGYDWLLWFLAMLSANLAVVNFLPIPILDGGHMVFLIYEKIRGKPPSRAVQEGALWLGLLFLACFVVFVTFNDITRLIPL